MRIEETLRFPVKRDKKYGKEEDTEEYLNRVARRMDAHIKRLCDTINVNDARHLLVDALPTAGADWQGKKVLVRGVGANPDTRYICVWDGSAFVWQADGGGVGGNRVFREYPIGNIILPGTSFTPAAWTGVPIPGADGTREYALTVVPSMQVTGAATASAQMLFQVWVGSAGTGAPPDTNYMTWFDVAIGSADVVLVPAINSARALDMARLPLKHNFLGTIPQAGDKITITVFNWLAGNPIVTLIGTPAAQCFFEVVEVPPSA